MEMGIEIEKKFQLEPEQKTLVEGRLTELGEMVRDAELEENVLFSGGNLDQKTRVLRIRRVRGIAILTYKELLDSSSAIKHRREHETQVEDPEAIVEILTISGYKPSLVYEKLRTTWKLAGAEVMIDELPFGLFMEIEGDEDSILQVEGMLGLSETKDESLSYPELTLRYGTKNGEIIEARFEPNKLC
jgi:adenylate cyclase class 2